METVTKCTLGRGPGDRACNGKCARCGWEAGVRERRNEIIAKGLEPGENGIRRLILPEERPMALGERECRWCGKIFVPSAAVQVYCCKKCCNDKNKAEQKLKRKHRELPGRNYEEE